MILAIKGKGPVNLKVKPGISDHPEGLFINWIFNF